MYGGQVIKKFEDLIYIKDNALEKDFCDHCIQKFNEDNRKKQGITGAGLRLDVKRSLDLNISNVGGWEEEDKIFYNSLHENMGEYFNLHDKQYSSMLTCSGIKDTGYQIQKTEPTEFYDWHSDYGVDEQGWSRILTFIWYLNDVKYAGETQFIMGNKIKPKKGTLMLFPATWTYVHRGCTPKKELKYICTGWVYSYFQFH
jgi:hypothetical protein